MSALDNALDKRSRIMIYITSMGNMSYGDEISKSLKLPNQTVFRVLHSMEKQGVLSSEKSERNGHKKIYSLTEDGKGKAEAILAKVWDNQSFLGYYRELHKAAYQKKRILM